jgi:putative FmdB family regulatory protein
MPVYEYECQKCGPFTAFRNLAESSLPAPCSSCGALSPKIFSLINMRSLRPAIRLAHERNERSVHAPHVCGSGCSHRHAASKTKPSDKPVLQSSTKRNRRPWMLGH